MSWWAATASYLPQRTDNDIKNYWNSHLKKKLRKLGTGLDGQHDERDEFTGSQSGICRGPWERRLQTDIQMARQALYNALSVDSKPVYGSNHFDHKPLHQVPTTANYAASTRNISRLLQGWMKGHPKSPKNELGSTACSLLSRKHPGE